MRSRHEVLCLKFFQFTANIRKLEQSHSFKEVKMKTMKGSTDASCDLIDVSLPLANLIDVNASEFETKFIY